MLSEMEKVLAPLLSGSTEYEEKVLKQQMQFTPIDIRSLSIALGSLPWKGSSIKEILPTISKIVDKAIQGLRRISLKEFESLNENNLKKLLESGPVVIGEEVPVGILGKNSEAIASNFVSKLSKELQSYMDGSVKDDAFIDLSIIGSRTQLGRSPITSKLGYADDMAAYAETGVASNRLQQGLSHYYSEDTVRESIERLGDKSPYIKAFGDNYKNLDIFRQGEGNSYEIVKSNFKKFYESLPGAAGEDSKRAKRILDYIKGSIGVGASALAAKKVQDKINNVLEAVGPTRSLTATIGLSARVVNRIGIMDAVITVIEYSKNAKRIDSVMKEIEKKSDVLMHIMLTSRLNGKTLSEMALDSLVDTVMGRRSKDFTVTANKRIGKINAVKPGISTSNPVYIKKPTMPTIEGSGRFRDLRGRFTNTTNIQNLISARLAAKIKENMHRPYLINRTGRFAESVYIKNLTVRRDGSVEAFLSYMHYPYQTFEPGYAQGSKGYDPRPLIEQSFRELAESLVVNRLRVSHV